MSIDDEFAARFTCSKCGNSGANVRRIAATGAGLSKFFDIQHNKYIAVSCHYCGYTELYDTRALESQSVAGDVLDAMFGA